MKPSSLPFAFAALLLLPARTVAGAEPPPTLRLPGTAHPTHYAAQIVVRPDQPTFSGTIDIDIAVDKPLTLLWLNARDLRIQLAEIVNGTTRQLAAIVPGGDNFVGLRVPRALPAGSAKVHIEYQGSLSRKDDRGLFAEKEGGRWYAITQFEPIFARRVFPCFDEPSYKVPWQLTVEAPKDDAILSNTAVESESTPHPGMRMVRFAPTRPLPSYLVAFAVGPYDLVLSPPAGQHHIPVRVAAPLGRKQDAQYAARITGQVVDRLEGYFGSPFPFDKLDAVTIPLPTQFGAMENPGMVTFAERYLIARPQDESLRFERAYTEVAAHEFAHQWFGDLVTTAWWNDIWLNESFASWMENKIVDAWHPEWEHHAAMVTAHEVAMASDRLMSARRIRQPIDSMDDIYNAFDRITYQKGESVLAMFEHFVGAERFRKGVQAYVARYADKNATADDFIAAVSSAAGQDLGAPFRSFLDQAGVPLVTGKLSCVTGKAPLLSLSQKRYLPLGSTGSAGETWQVPVCVRWGGGERCTLLKSAQATVPLTDAKGCPAWLDVNAGTIGYYHASYTPAALDALLARGWSALTLPEQLGLVDDIRAMVASGAMPLARVLELVPRLAKDAHRELVEAAVAVVAETRESVLADPLQPGYARFVQTSFAARAKRLGWRPSSKEAKEDEDTRLLRPELVALVADAGQDAALRTEAVTLTERWLNDRKAVDPELVSAVLATAAHNGDRALFDKMLTEAKRSGEQRDRVRILGALGQFRDPELAKAALALILTEDFDPREAFPILRNVSGWPATRELAWQFAEKNFDNLLKRLPAETMARLPEIGAALCDQAREPEISAFFASRSTKLPGGPRHLKQATEALRLCAAFVAAARPSASDFLSRY